MSANEVDARSPALVSPAAPSQTESAGLSEEEATRLLAQYGENALSEHHVSVFQRLAQFFWGPIPWMIEAAALLSGRLCHVAGATSAKCQRLMDGQAAATAVRHVVIATPRSARC